MFAVDDCGTQKLTMDTEKKGMQTQYDSVKKQQKHKHSKNKSRYNSGDAMTPQTKQHHHCRMFLIKKLQSIRIQNILKY